MLKKVVLMILLASGFAVSGMSAMKFEESNIEYEVRDTYDGCNVFRGKILEICGSEAASKWDILSIISVIKEKKIKCIYLRLFFFDEDDFFDTDQEVVDMFDGLKGYGIEKINFSQCFYPEARGWVDGENKRIGDAVNKNLKITS